MIINADIADRANVMRTSGLILRKTSLNDLTMKFRMLKSDSLAMRRAIEERNEEVGS